VGRPCPSECLPCPQHSPIGHSTEFWSQCNPELFR
jgi:hypothetical protein